VRTRRAARGRLRARGVRLQRQRQACTWAAAALEQARCWRRRRSNDCENGQHAGRGS
jgi:hypothetical protein